MNIHFTQPWDFELIDSGNSYRLERWGKYLISRPDPQAIWTPHLDNRTWHNIDATFQDDWQAMPQMQRSFEISWSDTKFLAKLTPFKHMGIFAEQAAHWEWFSSQFSVVSSQAKQNRKLKILNLFAYTGAATIVLTKLGHFVTHVDASKPAITWAKENQKLNNLPEDSIRWILDDAVKFVKRELSRGATYDGILLDPPAFGRSPQGKVWKFGEDFPNLLDLCRQLLSNTPAFLLVNAYATNSSAIALQNIMEDTLKVDPKTIQSGDLCLKQQDGRLLSTGIYSLYS